MLVRISDDRYLDVTTGTLLRVSRGAYPAVSYTRVDCVTRADEAAKVIEAIDLILAAQDSLLDHRPSIAPGYAHEYKLPPGVVDAR